MEEACNCRENNTRLLRCAVSHNLDFAEQQNPQSSELKLLHYMSCFTDRGPADRLCSGA